MTEIFLALSNLIFAGAILFYFYKREMKHREDAEKNIILIQEFYKQISLSKDKLAAESFKGYLKHIQALEKMVLPKPITKEMVNDILLQTPPMAENDIEKNAEDVNKENFMDVFSKIPIDNETKVAFENEIDAPAEQIIS